MIHYLKFVLKFRRLVKLFASDKSLIPFIGVSLHLENIFTDMVLERKQLPRISRQFKKQVLT
jgi:hypothetical protein